MQVSTQASSVVDNDQAPALRFLVVDSRVPAPIRQLLDEEGPGGRNFKLSFESIRCEVQFQNVSR